jgi:hypothetical protein
MGKRHPDEEEPTQSVELRTAFEVGETGELHAQTESRMLRGVRGLDAGSGCELPNDAEKRTRSAR